ncbi:fumarylacetoacetate hydrolase family protein [Brucella abortus]|nr:fumarylacetoacetate hydrolase family protein [Brucella abortus]
MIEGGDFPYPPKTEDVHHEIDLVVALKSGGSDIPVEKALDHVYGYAVGIDMTRRDLQAVAKRRAARGKWPRRLNIRPPVRLSCLPLKQATRSEAAISLAINGEMRQSGNLNQMIWKVPETISYLSSLFDLQPGDLIFTGTPAGVEPVKRGDRLEGKVDGVGILSVTVV